MTVTEIPYNVEHELEIQEVKDELDIDMVPGTEIMTDLKNVHFATNGHNSVLIPQPSNNPHDPLNWNKKWKIALVFGQAFISFFNALGPLSISPQAPAYMAEWNRSLADVIQFTGVCILVFGFSNFLWVPIATKYGRRVVILTSTLVGLGACIWRAMSHSYGSFMGAVVVHGIASGVSETIPPMLIADVFFLHERGAYMTLYMWSYFGAYILGPVFSGIMTERYGWRSFWWLNVAGYCFLLAWCVFLVPETSWDRQAPLPVETKTEISEKASDTMIETKQEVLLRSQDELSSGLGSPVAHDVVEHVASFLAKGYPSRTQFLPIRIGKNATPHSLFRAFWTPIRLMAFPIVEWGSFVFSWSASCFLMINLTQSQVFGAAPYNFTTAQVGYTNFGTFIGATIGLLVSGPFSDWVSQRATKKNKGVREPEMRLPSLIPFVLVIIVQMLVVSLGYQYKWHWAIIVVIGYTLTGLQVASIPSIASTYAVDCYKPVAGDYFVSATVNKNLWAYGVAKFITPWTEKSGYIPAFMTNMSLMLFFMGLGIVFYYYGKTMRKWTRNSSVHSQ